MPLNEYSPEHVSEHINLNELLSIMDRMLIAVTRILEHTENSPQLELLRSIDSKLSGRDISQYAPASAEQDIMRALGV